MKKLEVGVVVGRFQSPKLHAGHLHLLIETAKRHKNVLILLGSARVQNSRLNPLDYQTRKSMISGYFDTFKVQPLWDMPSDEDWSKQIDGIVAKLFPGQKATIYGSRDSCLKYYSGRLKTLKIPPISDAKATALRKFVKSRDSKNFREGVIYAANTALPTSFQAVDAVIVATKYNEITKVLLGRKKTDPKDKYRFIGGFVDPADESLEQAVIREAQEETGGSAAYNNHATYLGSVRVNDWRYAKEDSKIMTAVFIVYHSWGDVKPSDDISALKWFDLVDLKPEVLVPQHRPILKLFTDKKERV